MFHAKNLSYSYLNFLKEDFLSFYYIQIRKSMTPWGGPIWTPGLLFAGFSLDIDLAKS
jgi:hypothetical protein